MAADYLHTSRMHRYQITGSYMMADRSLAIFTPHGCIDTRNTPADRCMTTFIPAGSIEKTRTVAGSIGTAHGSYMVADRYLTIFIPHGWLLAPSGHLTAHDPHGHLLAHTWWLIVI